MSDVFISYCREDLQRACDLASALREVGWTVFLDQQIRPDQPFDEIIEQELDTAACVIVLWSQTSVRSEWVKNEASEGLKRDVLLPVTIDEHARIPLEFRRRQTVSLTDWRHPQPHEGFSALASEIQRRTGPRQSDRSATSPKQRPIPAPVLAGPTQPNRSSGSHRQKSTHAPALRPCAVTVNIFSGARTPIPAGTQVLLTIRDGNQNTLALPDNGYFNVPTINVEGLQFYDNFGDSYSVVAWAEGCSQAGFMPVKVSPQAPAIVDIMLLRKDATLNFRDADWDSLKQNHPNCAALLAAGAASDAAAQDRYTQLMEKQPAVLACFFNLVTAMSQIVLPVGTPLDHIRELIWGDSKQQGMKQDRFFAWADKKLIDQVIKAGPKQFAPEVGTELFHPGATRSWKHVQFGEANVRLTFHEGQTQRRDGVDCIVVEPDIDYYKDPLAHAILEVVVNQVTHSLTDPRQVYILRWMAGRHAGVPDSCPSYILE